MLPKTVILGFTVVAIHKNLIHSVLTRKKGSLLPNFVQVDKVLPAYKPPFSEALHLEKDFPEEKPHCFKTATGAHEWVDRYKDAYKYRLETRILETVIWKK